MKTRINYKLLSELQKLSEEECNAVLKKILSESNCEPDIEKIILEVKRSQVKEDKREK